VKSTVNLDLSKKNIIIVGGLGLLGRSFCDSIYNNGGNVIIFDREYDRNNPVLKIFMSEKNFHFYAVDITNSQSVKMAMNEVIQKFTQIHGLVNTAYPKNKNYGKELMEVTYEDFCENLSMNLGSYFLCCLEIAKHFKKFNAGKIINIASIYGVIPPRFDVYDGLAMTSPVEYAAIKGGLIHLTKYFAQYFKKSNIQINCISPGGIFDHQQEKFIKRYEQYSGTKGMLDPQDVVGTLLFLLSNQSQYITGQNIIVDDGFTL